MINTLLPGQYQFARLSLKYAVTSKCKLKQQVDDLPPLVTIYVEHPQGS